MKPTIVLALFVVWFPLAAQMQPNDGIEVSLQRDDATLRGTLRHPEHASQILIVHAGSGPTDRDGNQPAMKNNSLRLLVEGLAADGIAVLAFDKRGAGQTGLSLDESELRPSTYINDLAAWVNWSRKKHPDLAIHLLGHSEGALFAKAVARQMSDSESSLASVISLAGAGRPAGTLLREQTAGRLPGTLAKEFETVLSNLEQGETVSEVNPMLNSLFRPSVQPYLIEWLTMNPAVIAEALEVPLLVISGSADLQVVEADFRALSTHGDQAEWIDGMNHVLKAAKGPIQAQMASYTNPELPLHPDLLPLLSDWFDSFEDR